MATFNVLVSVVALIDADSPEDAVKILSARLRSHGEEVYSEGAHAFESEDQETRQPN